VRVTINANICQGHTLCSMAAPETFKLREDDGHAYVESEEVPDELRESVRMAAATCPEQAISVTED